MIYGISIYTESCPFKNNCNGNSTFMCVKIGQLKGAKACSLCITQKYEYGYLKIHYFDNSTLQKILNKILFLKSISLKNLMLIKYTCFENFILFNKLDNSSVTVLGVPFQPEGDSLQESFLNKDNENEKEQERSSNILSKTV